MLNIWMILFNISVNFLVYREYVNLKIKWDVALTAEN